MSAFEKVAFPTTLLIMILLQLWEPLAITLLAETAVGTGILVTVAKGHRLEYFFKGLLVGLALCRTAVRTHHDRPLCRRPVDLP